MLTMIAAALAAAQPAAPPTMQSPAPVQAPDVHAQHQKMGHQPGIKPGMMADMKDCCCKDKMAKMDGKHAGHQSPSDQHQNHKQ